MNVILFEQDELIDGTTVVARGPRGAHIRQVLGASAGDQIRVGIVDGCLGVGTVRKTAADGVELSCRWEAHPPPEQPVDLLLALPRPKVLKRLYAQLAALGVRRIILTNAARVERHYFDTHVLTAGCYRPLLIEGLQQARDTRLPEVSVHRQLRILIEDDLDRLSPGTHRLVAHPAEARVLSDEVRRSNAARLLLAIGPEGGWNAFELDLFAAAGFVTAGVGPRPLRSDTACIAILALAHDARERR